MNVKLITIRIYERFFVNIFGGRRVLPVILGLEIPSLFWLN